MQDFSPPRWLPISLSGGSEAIKCCGDDVFCVLGRLDESALREISGTGGLVEPGVDVEGDVVDGVEG